jgi:hypothetical protein
MNKLIEHFGYIKSNALFRQLVNLKQRGPVTNHIQHFQKLCLKVKNILKKNLLDLFMGSLQESLQHEVCLFEPKPLENVLRTNKKNSIKNIGISTQRLDKERI